MAAVWSVNKSHTRHPNIVITEHFKCLHLLGHERM